jgi:hypothetical protein
MEAYGTRWTTGVGKRGYPAVMDEGRKRVLLIAPLPYSRRGS